VDQTFGPDSCENRCGPEDWARKEEGLFWERKGVLPTIIKLMGLNDKEQKMLKLSLIDGIK